MGHKGKRIYNLELPDDYTGNIYIVLDKAGWEHPKKYPLSGLCGLITDQDIIDEITKKENWVNKKYVGDETLLKACDWYLDRKKMIMYRYDGVELVRWGVDNVL